MEKLADTLFTNLYTFIKNLNQQQQDQVYQVIRNTVIANNLNSK